MAFFCGGVLRATLRDEADATSEIHKVRADVPVDRVRDPLVTPLKEGHFLAR